MAKKTIASVSLAVAATASTLLLTGSPASAQTTSASAHAIQTRGVSAESRLGDHRSDRWRHRWGDDRGHYRHHHHHYGNRHADVDITRIVISSSDTGVSVSD